MKKTLIAMGVAAVVAAPSVMADTTVYGQAEAWVQNSDRSGDSTGSTAVGSEKVGGGTSGFDVQQDNRIGFKGSEDLGNGMTAVYKAEFQVVEEVGGTNADDITLRDQYVGLSGGFGTVVLGRLETPTEKVTNHVDIMQGASAYHASGDQGRIDNVAAYISPKYAGAQLLLATSKDGGTDRSTVGSTTNGTTNTQTLDNAESVVNAGLLYSNGALDFSVAVHDQKTDAFDTVHVGGGYKFGNLGLGASYVNYDDAHRINIAHANDSSGLNVETQNARYDDALSLAASYELDNNVIKLQHSKVDVQNVTSGTGVTVLDGTTTGTTTAQNTDDITTIGVELEHKLSKRTSAYVNFNDRDGVAATDDEKMTQIGLIHKF